MMGTRVRSHRFSESDLEFLIDMISPRAAERQRLRQLLSEDSDFVEAFLEDEKTLQAIIASENVFVRISPELYFEVLLRQVRKQLADLSFTVEKSGLHKIPVFDAEAALELLEHQGVLDYLSQMLASFTKVENFAVSYRSRKGTWRRIRFSDLDIDNLIRFSETATAADRFVYLRRIADICLFVLGMFEDYVESSYRYPLSGQLRPQVGDWVRRSPEGYEEEGRRFYQLAADHPLAQSTGLADTLLLLREEFATAKKPLQFLADRYLRFQKQQMKGTFH